MKEDELKIKITKKVQWYIDKYNIEQVIKGESLIENNLRMPNISFKLRGNSAGKAYLNDEELRFNLKYAEQNLEKFLTDTVPHEIAHWAEWSIYGTTGHKVRWKGIMQKLGIDNPSRCHTYMVDKW